MSIFSLDDWCSYWSGQRCSSNSLFSLLFSLDCELPPAVCASSPTRWIAHSIWNTLTSRSENKQNISPQLQETVLGNDFQPELVCATWKTAFSLAVIDSDSLNPSRSYPSHSVGSRVACVVDIPNPARLDVYICTKSRQETTGRAGSLVESCFWSPVQQQRWLRFLWERCIARVCGTLDAHIEIAWVTPQPQLLEVFVSVNSNCSLCMF